MRQRGLKALVALLALFPTTVVAQESRRNNSDRNRVILKGFDTVSYFTADKPVLGDPKFSTEYQGAVYRFASAENRQKFLADPQKFRPEYGGWCAKAIADEEYVDIDPLNFKITNGRLFLFYKGFLGDALRIWNRDEANLTRRADTAWRELTSK